MARTGIDFAESCVRHMAKNAGEELAASVRVTVDPARERYTITCGKRSAFAEARYDAAEFARELSNAVETVMGLREPKEEA